MDHLWQRTLEAQRAKFEFVSRTEGELELSMQVDPHTALSASTAPVGLEFTFIYSREPKRWWNCCFHGSRQVDHLASEYFRLADETGRICQAVPGIEKLFPANSEWIKQGWGLDDFWTIVLFQLAWARPPGTPLWAVSEQITKDGYHSVSGSVAASVPIGLRSRLRIPPFSASGHAIAFIGSGGLSSAPDPLIKIDLNKVPAPATEPHLDATDQRILLLLLGAKKRLKTEEIASKLKYKPGSIGQNLSKLRSLGYLDNQRPSKREPKRQVGYSLMPLGIARAQKIRAK